MCSNFRDPSSVAPFVEQRVTEAVTTTNVVGGQVTMHHNSRVMQGDSIAHDLFASPYEEQITKWLSTTEDSNLLVYSLFPTRR